MEEVCQSSGDGGAKEGLALGYGGDGVENFGFVGSFKDVTPRSGAHGGEEGVVVFEHSQHDDAGVGVVGQDAAGGFDAVHVGHLDVHEDDFGGKGLCLGNGFSAGSGLTYDFSLRSGIEEGD